MAGWGTAYRGEPHTVLYLRSKDPKGKPGWEKKAQRKQLKILTLEPYWEPYRDHTLLGSSSG